MLIVTDLSDICLRHLLIHSPHILHHALHHGAEAAGGAALSAHHLFEAGEGILTGVVLLHVAHHLVYHAHKIAHGRSALTTGRATEHASHTAHGTHAAEVGHLLALGLRLGLCLCLSFGIFDYQVDNLIISSD